MIGVQTACKFAFWGCKHVTGTSSTDAQMYRSPPGCSRLVLHDGSPSSATTLRVHPGGRLVLSATWQLGDKQRVHIHLVLECWTRNSWLLPGLLSAENAHHSLTLANLESSVNCKVRCSDSNLDRGRYHLGFI